MQQHRLVHIELPLHPGWDAIEPLRDSVVACVKAVFPSPTLSCSVAVVAAELLENAVKHGRWEGAPRAGFALRVDGLGDRVEIAVSNPISEEDAHLPRLLAELERIAAAPSPQEAYMKAVRALALGRERVLGLARAAHEGGCDLSAEVKDGVVNVRAVTRGLGPPPPTPAAPA